MKAQYWIVKRREFEGLTRNRFAKGGVLKSYSKWKTIARETCENNAEFTFAQETRKPGLFQVAIYHLGKRIKYQR